MCSNSFHEYLFWFFLSTETFIRIIQCFQCKNGLSYSQIHVWHVYVLQRPCKFLSGIDFVLFILEFCKLTDLYIFSCYLISHRNVLEKMQLSIHISIVYTFFWDINLDLVTTKKLFFERLISEKKRSQFSSLPNVKLLMYTGKICVLWTNKIAVKAW